MNCWQPASPIAVSIGLICALTARGWGQDLDYEVAPLPEAEIRSSARKILDDPAFAGFDHFQREIPPSTGSSIGSPTGTTASPAANSEAGESDQTKLGQTSPSERPPQTWWERLQQNQQRHKSDDSPGTRSDRSGSTPTESQPATGSSTTPPADSATGSSSKTSPANEAAAGPPRTTATDATTPHSGNSSNQTESAAESTERPQRGNSVPAGTPVRRGGDGIERPVRFAPKPKPTPSPPSNSDWNLDWGLGNAFAGFGRALGGLLHFLAYAGVAILVILIFVLAARGLSEWFRGRSQRAVAGGATPSLLADDRSPGEVAADVYREQALEFARNGDFRAAIGSLLLGAMSTIERQQWIRYRRGLTLADYLRSVRSKSHIHDGLRTIVGVHEPVEFGRRTATQAGFESALDGYSRAFSQ